MNFGPASHLGWTSLV